MEGLNITLLDLKERAIQSRFDRWKEGFEQSIAKEELTDKM